MMTLPDLQQCLPPALRSTATQELVDKINQSISDPEAAEIYKQNLVDYSGVLQTGKYKASSYLEAVRYVTFKLLGHTNNDAYAKTFPDKYRDFLARGMSSKDISAYVSAYAAGKLVNQILEQTLVPFWLVNQKVRQEALNRQVELMYTASSELVQTQAANSVLTHTVEPKAVGGPLINIDMRENSGMKELKNLLGALAQKQIEAIQSGVSTKIVAEQGIATSYGENNFPKQVSSGE